MKRSLTLILSLLLGILPLTACNQTRMPEPTEQTQTENPSQSPTEVPTEAPTEAETDPPKTPDTLSAIIEKEGTYDVEILKKIAVRPKDEYNIAQGACSDDTYAYCSLKGSEDTYSLIVKIELATGKQVAVSEPLELNHCNDMTYIPATNEIIVCHNAPNRKLISYVDADTLTLTRTIDIGRKIFSIAYDPIGDRYVVGRSGGTNFEILDHDFSVLKSCTGVEGSTTQGVYCDHDYIYFPMSGSNRLMIYNWDGEFIVRINLNFGHEAEAAFWGNGNLWLYEYTGYANGGMLYRLEITKKE